MVFKRLLKQIPIDAKKIVIILIVQLTSLFTICIFWAAALHRAIHYIFAANATSAFKEILPSTALLKF